MAEITRYRKGELVRGVFKILINNPDGLKAKNVLKELESIVPPTEFENTCYPDKPNIRRYEKIVRFSTISPVKAGWLVKEKGQWTITDEGKKAFEKYTDPEKFSFEASKLYKQWKQEQPQHDEHEDESGGADIATTLEEAEETAWSEIEKYLTEMNPYDFQDLVAGLLRGMGYHVGWVAPPGPDKGVDIIAHLDPLGIEGPRIKAQVKRQELKVSVQSLRSFMAILSDSDVGLFVSTGGFTKDAEDEARHKEKTRLMLVDLKRLFDLWVEHYDKIPEVQRRLLPLRTVHFLAPSD
jgi:restriction system protein